MGKKFVGLDGLKHFWTKAKTWITGQITAEVTAKIAEIVANAPEDLDTLKEIADWISAHVNDAAAMNTQINTNKNNIAALQTSVAGKAAAGHTHTKSEITDFPTSLPANGGTADKATSANLSKTLDTVNGDKLQIGSGTAQNVTNAKHAATAEHAITADNGVPTYSTSDAGKNLAVNSSGNAVGWVKPQTIKFVDYKTEQLTFSSITDQKKIELSNFGPEVTENNVLNFMTIYWSNVHIIAHADWSKSQGTGSSGMACALHSLNTGTGYAVIRCVYLA